MVYKYYKDGVVNLKWAGPWWFKHIAAKFKLPSMLLPFVEIWCLYLPCVLIPRSSDIKPPLRVHPSFFSLIRDIFTAAPNHRLTISKLKESLASWQRSPMSLLTAWAILQPSWAKVVDGAMKFLNGEIDVTPEVIPRVRYDEERQMWQWRSKFSDSTSEKLFPRLKSQISWNLVVFSGIFQNT